MRDSRIMNRALSQKLKKLGMTERLILTNSILFVTFQLFLVYSRLISPTSHASVQNWLGFFFGLEVNLSDALKQPWGLITSLFSHFQFWHFVMNMLFLFFIGKLFEQYFNGYKLLAIYLIGGIFGGLSEILANAYFPALSEHNNIVLGASGSIMAILAAMSIAQPSLTVRIFGVVPIRIVLLAALFILADLAALGLPDNTAHFAHLGGVIVGVLSTLRRGSRWNTVNLLAELIDRISKRLQHLFSNKSPLKVIKNDPASTRRVKSDEDYLNESRARQLETDRILDKISVSGYDSLTRKEKEFLFRQSKND
jgi:membrane associated rhomboid family serine protease